MDIGITLIEGCVLGIRTFKATNENPYKELQVFILFICIYVTWD
tara:strand:- start:260 stop:391 length:132 start_codon:yes stop_codon:yes gene_type:complete